jgi:hypothetical protein
MIKVSKDNLLIFITMYENLKEVCFMPIKYVITSLVCCKPIGCCDLCVEMTNEDTTEPVKIIEVKSPITDYTICEQYTCSDHTARQITENPLHTAISIKINN